MRACALTTRPPPPIRARRIFVTFCLAWSASGAALAQALQEELGTIRFDNWLSYQRNTDGSGQWQYDPRVFIPIKLSNGWTFTQRFDLPVLHTNAVGPDNPTGSWKSGIGDWYIEELLAPPPLSENFKVWASVRLVFPTGGEGPFGSGQYQWAPAVSAIYSAPEHGITFNPVARYFMSFHATEPGAAKIRQLALYPILAVTLPQSWSLTFYPENGIFYNAVTHKWFVPIDLLLGKRVANDVEVGLGAAVPLTNNNRAYKYNLYGRVTFYF